MKHRPALNMRYPMLKYTLAAFLLLFCPSANAGVDKSGVKPQVLSLPKGPGSIEGLGESFEPQLNSGTTSYAIQLKVPPGRKGFQPELTLRYNGGAGNGPFGIGWSLSVGHIQRQTDKGLPEYDASDTFIESGGEELVPLADGTYRHENEGAFVRYVRSGEGWTAKDRSGGSLKYGLVPETQIRSGDKVFCWLLEEKTDTNGNAIRYAYSLLDDGPQRYLTRIAYNENGGVGHEIVFDYESRPDALPDYRPTFRLETAHRCKTISMLTGGQLVRRYVLDYIDDSPVSTLESVTQVGRDGVSTLPPAAFTYTRFDPSKAVVVTMEGREDGVLPPFLLMAYEPSAALNDMNADGLPDLLYAEAGEHLVFTNLGVGSDRKHRWGEMTDMGSASPGEALANDGASLADIDGDGKTDFIARRSSDTYFLWPNTGTGAWGEAKTFADNSNLPFDFENSAVRLIDINNDKHIDVMYCSDRDGDYYSYFINNGGAEFTNVIAKPGLGWAMTFDQRPGMKLADMNGDRLQDIVLLQDGVFTYWPSKGFGEWDLEQRGNWYPNETGTGTRMANPPYSEADALPSLYYDYPGLMLVDLNGDGLTDVVYAPEGATRIFYWLNLDSERFEGPLQVENVPVRLGGTTVQPGDMNGNGTTDILWNFPEDSDINRDEVWQYLELCPDEKPYLLKTVTNGIGRTVTFSYSTTTEEYVRDRNADPWPEGVPNVITVLGEYEVDDGRGNRYRAKIEYHDGYYDGEDKEFRGFAKAEKREIGDASAPDLVMRYTFDTGAEEDSLKGKPLLLEALADDELAFYRESYTWVPRILAEGANGDDRKVTFPYQVEKLRTVLEKGNGDPVQLKWEYEYDNYGNVTRQIDHGRLDGDWDDERITETAYTAGYPSGLSNWILDKPVEASTKDEHGVKAAHKKNYYDGSLNLGDVAKGNLTRVEDWAAENDYVVSVRNAYDSYGNIVAIYDPLYPSEPGHYRELAYDPVYHTFPVEEKIYTGSLVLTMSATYDYGFGAMTTSTDYNGHTTAYGYDALERLTSITKPPDAEHTLEYDYVLAHDLGGGNLINWVETRQRDGSPGDGFLRSRTFYDGMGRKIMTRTEGENDGQVVVTDTVQFNARKSPWKKYLPYFESGDLDFADPTFNTGFTEHFYDALGRETRVNQPVGPDGILFSTTVYEPLSKTVRDEEQTRSGTIHAGCGMRYVEDGLQDKDGNGRLREVFEIVKLSDAGEPLSSAVEWKTSYTYDLLDKLTGYTDSQNNRKIMAYDWLGRKTFMNDPDRGHMHYEYDDAGNLKKTVDAKNQVVEYKYDGVNRLTEEYYGEGKQLPDVQYHYDLPGGPVNRGDLWKKSLADVISGEILRGDGYSTEYDLNSDGKLDVADVVKAAKANMQSDSVTAENTRGFLSWVEDQSGEEHNSYDTRGRVKWVVKRIINTGPDDLRNFYTGMRYDAMDRVAELTYPDGTTIVYNYNSRGMLESVPGVIEGYDYNPAGQNASLSLACGTTTSYDYDHRLRMNRLRSVRASDGLPLQDLSYIYDGVSNITTITDGRTNAHLDAIGVELGLAVVEARKFNATQSFEYDSLYRLTKAANASVYGTISYRYDRIGNMINKSANLLETDPLMDLGDMTSGGTDGTTERIGREPGEQPGPHAITGTEKGPDGPMAFAYDDNGNMTSEREMTLSWDYKDRLSGLTNDTKTADYVYDFTDTRKKKKVVDYVNGSNAEVVYIDKFSEIRSGGLVKYAYAGNNRVARSDVFVPSFVFRASSFYLHDHLGSTNITLKKANGSLHEHMVNFPFGLQRKSQVGIEGISGAYYRFTGKELDGESDLMYFEARYYNPVVGRFVSVDPLYADVDELEKNQYIKFLKNPQENNLNVYVQNHPVTFFDPNGLKKITFLCSAGYSLGAGVGDNVDTSGSKQYGRFLEIDFKFSFENGLTIDTYKGRFVSIEKGRIAGAEASGNASFGFVFGGKEGLLGKSKAVGVNGEFILGAGGSITKSKVDGENVWGGTLDFTAGLGIGISDRKVETREVSYKEQMNEWKKDLNKLKNLISD